VFVVNFPRRDPSARDKARKREKREKRGRGPFLGLFYDVHVSQKKRIKAHEKAWKRGEKKKKCLQKGGGKKRCTPAQEKE